MKIEQIKASKLKPATYNPRQISTKQYKDLKNSITKFGLVDPIIVNKNGYVVIGGHQRLKVLNEMQTDTIPCVVLNLSKEKAIELLNEITRINNED
jgi:ParB/RepB/Spo0J family partition protein